jgi:hypothetical protein
LRKKVRKIKEKLRSQNPRLNFEAVHFEQYSFNWEFSTRLSFKNKRATVIKFNHTIWNETFGFGGFGQQTNQQ